MFQRSQFLELLCSFLVMNIIYIHGLLLLNFAVCTKKTYRMNATWLACVQGFFFPHLFAKCLLIAHLKYSIKYKKRGKIRL